MSKADGRLIAIRFDKKLGGDVTGLDPTPVGGTEELQVTNIQVEASNVYSSYVATNLVDGSTSTMWQTRLAMPQYATFTLYEAFAVTKIRVYNSSSYRINGITFQGSNDGTTFTDLTTGNCTNATGWNEFTFTNETAYMYYRLVVTSQYTAGRLYAYEFEMYYTRSIGQEIAFSVTGQEYDHVDGELVDGDYQVQSVERHPTDDDAILLTMFPLKRFNNVIGNLTVAYNASLGTLAKVVALASFSEEFTPTDLLGKPNQWDDEYILATIVPAFVVTAVTYKYGYNDNEYITATIVPAFVVTKVGDDPL